MKTNVYIDGFNLYCGCLRGTPYRWLDVETLSRQILDSRHTIQRIRYFTARVSPRLGNPGQDLRQQTYIRALETLPTLTVHYGHYLAHPVRLPLAAPVPGGPVMADVVRTEEKGSDVNLATYLLVDGYEGEYEAAVVISNDSDLALPLEIVRDHLGRIVGVLNPHQRPTWPLRNAATFYRSIRVSALRASQFPSSLQDAHGTMTKPVIW